MLNVILFASAYVFAIAVLALLREIAQQIRQARHSLEYELRRTRREVERQIAELEKLRNPSLIS